MNFLNIKRCGVIIIFLLSSCMIAKAETQVAIIRDVRGEILDDSAQIIIEANCDLDYVDYTLQNPCRLIIDPIGKVYSDLKETITFKEGPVKNVTIIKGKPEEGLTGNFYPLDFISIELKEAPEYKVKKDVKGEVIVDITKKKEEVQQLVPKEEKPVEPVKEEVIPLPEITIEKKEEKKVEEPKKEEVIPLEEPKKEIEAPIEVEVPELIYRIGEGDNLDISVWQHPELDKKVIVRPDGFISFPLVGDIKASGFTPPQLASNIKENLSRLIKDPQVTVIVSGFGSKNIFVLGEVAKPGVYQYRGGVSVLEAISEAGGWKNSAVLNSVMLVRKMFAKEPEAYRLDVYGIIKRGDFSQNLSLEPGDVVYVPKSFIANIGGFIENLRISVGAYITETTKVFD